jgi:hypothetical protein
MLVILVRMGFCDDRYKQGNLHASATSCSRRCFCRAKIQIRSLKQHVGRQMLATIIDTASCHALQSQVLLQGSDIKMPTVGF